MHTMNILARNTKRIVDIEIDLKAQKLVIIEKDIQGLGAEKEEKSRLDKNTDRDLAARTGIKPQGVNGPDLEVGIGTIQTPVGVTSLGVGTGNLDWQIPLIREIQNPIGIVTQK